MPIANKKNSEVFGKAKICCATVIVFLVVMGISSCSKRQVIVPRLTQEPTNLRLVGKFVWFDLFTNDLQTASH